MDIQFGSKKSTLDNTPDLGQALAEPSDPNRPCNTLYLSNLSVEISEDRLIGLFSGLHGYKRLCFLTKQSGLTCFVEFEDENWASAALNILNNHSLGFESRFSRNMLGRRSSAQSSDNNKKRQGSFFYGASLDHQPGNDDSPMHSDNSSINEDFVDSIDDSQSWTLYRPPTSSDTQHGSASNSQVGQMGNIGIAPGLLMKSMQPFACN